MKKCYCLVLALLLLVITPVAATDFMNNENYLEVELQSGTKYGTMAYGYPVTLRVVDENGYLIPDVLIKVYRYGTTATLVVNQNSASGELYITNLQAYNYRVEVIKSGYTQRLHWRDTAFNNQNSPVTLDIVMDSQYPSPPLTLQAIDGMTGSLISDVYFKIYYYDPVTSEQGALVKNTSVTSTGEIVVKPPKGHYCFEAIKEGYTLRYPVTYWTFQTITNPPESVACILDPQLPMVEDPGLRRGTVTMTDHNGTTITGFEVTAVNAYTLNEYTVSTDTDVAVIELPMDRTTQIRNSDTGEYEVVPIGYYKFFGQAPGYKMLLEEGIQVAVTPEKYSSYQLCNILVTSESGPLTGKHKFQIRSRADNSILQTGTISAQSVTTGEWYNTSVSGGIATLILAYDTTSIISEYAGLYKVYATSPGYENDYGTQISVYPQTVSEVKTVLLTPIGGVSPPDNVTLRIQAVSETGTGVVNAEIFIAGVYGPGKDVWNTYTASSTGYLTVSLPGNSTYDIVASGDGFYDSARRIEVFTEDPGLIELKLYLSGYPTLTPPTQPTGWPTDPPTQPTGGIPDEDDDSDGFLVQAVRGIGMAFGVGFSTAKIIFGMLLALSIGFATAKQLRGGAAEFGIGLLGGTMLGVLIGLLPVWIVVVLMLVVGLYYGNRYVGGANSG